MNPYDKSIVTLERPLIFTSTQEIKYYTFYVSQVIPHTEATICINLFSRENLNVKCIYARLINEDYQNWGTDDSYLDIYVNKYLFDNFSLSFGPADPPPAEPIVETPVAPPAEPILETPVETPVAPPAEPIVETPVAPPAEPILETPVAPPAEPIVETPVAPPAEPIVETPAEPIVETPVAPPAEPIVETPAEPIVETPAETPTEPTV